MEFPDDLRYTQEHEWLRLEGNEALVGITDFAQDALGDVDRLGPVVVSVSRQRPAHWRVIHDQAECAIRVLGTKLDLGENVTRHPHNANIRLHVRTITRATRRTTACPERTKHYR